MWIKFTPCGLRITSLVNDKNHTINNLQPLQRFFVLERLLFHTLQIASSVIFDSNVLINVIWHHFLTPVTYIVYRLNSGRESYIASGGKLGRKKCSVKSTERKKEEYKEVISLLKHGYSVRNTAKFCIHEPATAQQSTNILCARLTVAFKRCVSTVQRVKREFSI